MRPSVAVAIPTYRRNAEVLSAVRSAAIAAEGVCDITIGVFDNDPSSVVEEVLQKEWGTVSRYFGTTKNRGYLWNWRRCIEWAEEERGEFRLLLEDDNRLEPDFFAATLAVLTRGPQLDYAFTSSTEFDDTGAEEVWTPSSRRGVEAFSGEVGRKDMLCWCFYTGIKVSGLIVRNRNEARGTLRFDVRSGLVADYRSLCRMALASRGGYYVAEPLMRYRRNPVSLSSDAAAQRWTSLARMLWITRENCREIVEKMRPSRREWDDLLPTIGTDKLRLARTALWGVLSAGERALARALEEELARRGATLPRRDRIGSRWAPGLYWKCLAAVGRGLEGAEWVLSRGKS